MAGILLLFPIFILSWPHKDSTSLLTDIISILCPRKLMCKNVMVLVTHGKWQMQDLNLCLFVSNLSSLWLSLANKCDSELNLGDYTLS